MTVLASRVGEHAMESETAEELGGRLAREDPEFEIMEAGCRPHPKDRYPAWNSTFSVGIRPVVSRGRKATAWVRVSGSVADEPSIDRATEGLAVIMNGGGRLLPRPPRGIQFKITPSGRDGGLTRRPR